MPSIKDYQDRLRLLENHIGSLRKQNGDLHRENESLKEENESLNNENKTLKADKAKIERNFSSAIEKLNKMDQLLSEKAEEHSKLETKIVEDQTSFQVENLDIEIGPEFDFDLQSDPNYYIKELETLKYTLERVASSKYKCPIDKNCRFEADRSKMIEHTRKHTGERPFQCTLCKTNFVTKSTVRRHIQSVHVTYLSGDAPAETPKSTPVSDEATDGGVLSEQNSPMPWSTTEEPRNTRQSLGRSCKKRKIDDLSF